MDSNYLRSKHEAGLIYEAYVATGNPQQQENWRKIHEQAGLTDAQRQLIVSWTRPIKVIGLSGIWCGDCVQQCPLMARIAEANPRVIDLRWLDRDQHMDLQQRVAINAGHRVPVLIFCAEDYELVSWYGDRTLTRYRGLAQRKLGAACPLPGAPLAQDELAQTLAEWLNEFERVHWLLRLSTRFRKIYND